MRSRSVFDTVRVVGGLLPSNLLERVGERDDGLEGASPANYFLAPGERLGEAITRSWNRLRTLWERFSERLEEEGALTGPTRQEWLLPLFQELGFGHLESAPGFEVGAKAYPISHVWKSTPIHLVGVKVDLDRRSPGVAGAATASPHGLVQEFLNRSDEFQWAIVSNGVRLRLLRDNASLTRAAYVEFDLREMFTGETYSDFAVLWLTCHASRLDGPAGKQLLERWREDAARQGVRALDALRDGVETAIETLGGAAVSHPANLELRRHLDDGSLDARELYRQILRVVYRFLFLLVAEGRDLLLSPDADHLARSRYQQHYSITRLRELAETTRGGHHPDLWHQHLTVARALERTGEPALGLPALGGFLWSAEAIDALNQVTISNEDLLTAMRALTTVRPDGGASQRVDYANLGSEELGSIYESLLEYTPEVNPVAGTFELKMAAGNERKTTGSYYTPTSLINELLNSALDPVVDDAAQADDPEQAILDLKVVDPASGSGHFLIAAANRIADRLARIRAGDDEPSPDQLRTALRDVIGQCVYAVDINPMAVELAKVALWVETMEPGKPLTFLDHHIVCGNSLLGVTPSLLEDGIPDDAYKAFTYDDKSVVKALRARNRDEREKRLVPLAFGDAPDELLRHAAEEIDAIDQLGDTTVDQVTEKQRRYQQLIETNEQRSLRLTADTWVAAFIAPKTSDSPQITTSTVNAALHDPEGVPEQLASYVTNIAQRLRFHHWHLAFPHIFTRTENHQDTPRAGGFDVVLGNPPWLSYSGRAKTPISPHLLGLYKFQFPEISSWPSSHSAFLLLANRILAEHGAVGMVAPLQVAHLAQYKPLRERVSAVASVAVLNAGERAFANVTQAVGLFTFTRESSAPTADSAWKPVSLPNSPETSERSNTEQEDDRLTFALVQELAEYEPFPPAAFGDVGVHTGNVSKLIVSTSFPDDSSHPPVREGRNINAYHCGPPVKRLWVDPVLSEGQYCTIRLESTYKGTPILLRQTADRPIACRHTARTYFRNTLIACNGIDGIDDTVLVAVLNSELIKRWYQHQTVESGQKAFPQVKIRNLRTLPMFPPELLLEPYGESTLSGALGQETKNAETEASKGQVTLRTRLKIEELVHALYQVPAHLTGELLASITRASEGQDLDDGVPSRS